MPPRTSSRARTSVRSRKSSGKVTDNDSVQVTPPTSPAVVSVPPTPRTVRISPRKRETPTNSPAVQMRAPPPTPVVSRRLSFGTIEDVVVDASQIEAGSSQSSSSPRKLSARAPKVASAVTEKEEVVSVTPVKNGKRKHESPPSSPSPASTVKASKRVVLSPKDLKERRQANPAKRIRPIARLDSDDSDVVIVGETQLAAPSAGSLEENNMSEDEVDELWPDTPRPSLVSKSLVLSLLDVEAEEAAEGDDEMEDEQEEQLEQEQGEQQEDLGVVSAWEDSPPPKSVEPKGRKVQVKGQGKANVRSGRMSTGKLQAPTSEHEEQEDAGVVSVWEDSPPPKHVEPKGHKVQAKGRSGAKAQSGGMELPLTGKLQPSTPRPRSGIPPPIFAHDLGSSADIFGSPVDDSTGGVDNSMDINGASGSAKANHTELLDGIVFAGIHPLLSDIVTYLRSSGIASRLQYSELLPKYTARDEREGDVPKFLNVMGRMKNEYAMPIIVDCLCFRGYGVYVNPLTADPAHFRVVNKKIMFKPSVKRLLYPVFVMPVVVQLCDLLTPTCTSERFQEERLRLTGWIFDEVSALFATFIGSILNQNIVYAYMTESTLQFTSRPAKVEASVPSTPQKSAQHSFAFGRPSPRAGNKAGQSAAKAAPQFTHLRHPHSLGAEDTIPIYDGRSGHGDFRAEDQQWETIANMPRLGVPTPPFGQQPDYSQAVEIPPFEPTQFCVALVAFTMGTFMPMDNPAAPHVSFNLQFAVLLESWVSKLKPHAVTEQRINALRIAAASQANTLANAAATTQLPN